MKKFLLLIIIISIFAGLIIIRQLNRTLWAPIVSSEGLVYYVEPNQSEKQLVTNLEHLTNLKHRKLFYELMRMKGLWRELCWGEYFFPAGSTMGDVIDILLSGKVVRHRFTLVDGWNIYDVLDALKQDPYVQHTLNGVSLAAIAKQLDVSHKSPEGLLFPETYFYTWRTKDISILQRAAQKMTEVTNDLWPNRASDLPYTSLYQALIVASMIEKETSEVSEMPVIADIILKRWKKPMRLQIDASVIYGLEPNFSGSLTRDDLRRKTAYNTYRNDGLPPTPIAMPGEEAITAALHPKKTKAWYYVSKGDGTHRFSETYKEHRQAIQLYLGRKLITDV